MRIPLDYYRILGLPIQATAEQLQQAHRDRTLQLPRREFSETAIEARKALVDEAYGVLSDPVQRQEYDATFLAKSYELEISKSSEPLESASASASGADADLSDPYVPSIDIKDSQFAGALLILLELGEYELVLKLGRPYIAGGNLSVKNGRFGDPEIVSADIVLTVAFACLELGREQWQQGQYENAAESLEAGQELLLREGLFPNIRGEMQTDLYKLRPYRILELVALPEARLADRHQGLTLLQEMLEDRGGIDGTGDDQSGLSVDDFLRFIQQLRGYLTSAEQHNLFEAEARRPSAVAIYLAVYALLARGFTQRQPALIRRAKQMLLRLGNRQDVHLEQAVCALLLGQTEEASRALELSQEFESLTFIRENSQGSPDLLPGLCLYSECWLQNEVFPHFRDLARKQASLKEYFADEDVQAYLEELPNEPEPIANPRVAPVPVYHDIPRSEPSPAAAPRVQTVGQTTANSGGRSTATIDAPRHGNNGNSPLPTAERVSPPSSDPVANGNTIPTGRPSSRPSERNRGQSGPAPRVPGISNRRSRSGLRLDRLLFVTALGVLGLLILGFLFSRFFSRTQTAQTAGASDALQAQSMQSSLQDFLNQQEAGLGATSPLTLDSAQKVIEAWFAAKAAAMGETHAADQLATILTEPALSQWKERAAQVKADGGYLKYEHANLKVLGVDATPDSPNQAKIEATVSEKIESVGKGQTGSGTSQPADNLKVRYSLVRQNGNWLIQSMEVE